MFSGARKSPVSLLAAGRVHDLAVHHQEHAGEQHDEAGRAEGRAVWTPLQRRLCPAAARSPPHHESGQRPHRPAPATTPCSGNALDARRRRSLWCPARSSPWPGPRSGRTDPGPRGERSGEGLPRVRPPRLRDTRPDGQDEHADGDGRSQRGHSRPRPGAGSGPRKRRSSDVFLRTGPGALAGERLRPGRRGGARCGVRGWW